MMHRTINPYSEEVLAEYPMQSSESIDESLAASHAVFQRWRYFPAEQRAQCVRLIAKALRAGCLELATLVSQEMGKPLQEAQAEIEKSATACDYYAGHGLDLLAGFEKLQNFDRSFVKVEAKGPVLIIMPWNFPVWQVLRQTIPNLLIGNAVLLKHAPNVSGCALALMQIIQKALSDWRKVFQTLLVDHKDIRKIIDDRRVVGVAFTGSTATGRLIGEAAGQALKKSVLELGGSDPYIVLPGADLQLVVESVMRARFANAGQSCIAAKRLLVHRDLMPTLSAALIERLEALQLGDPLVEATQMGPLARRDLQERLSQQVQTSLGQGAKILFQKNFSSAKGFFYPPTLLHDVTPTNTAFCEEVFGPVLSLVEFDDVAESIQLANDSDYGLGAALFGESEQQLLALAERLQAGGVAINSAYHSDPRLPFGGTAQSGYGRELGLPGLLEFANIKSLVRPLQS